MYGSINPIHTKKSGIYRGIHYFFLFLLRNKDCGDSLEPPHNLWLEQKYEKHYKLSSDILGDVKDSIKLHRRVRLMYTVCMDLYI